MIKRPGGGTPIHMLYGDVLPFRVWFSRESKISVLRQRKVTKLHSVLNLSTKSRQLRARKITKVDSPWKSSNKVDDIQLFDSS